MNLSITDALVTFLLVGGAFVLLFWLAKKLPAGMQMGANILLAIIAMIVVLLFIGQKLPLIHAHL